MEDKYNEIKLLDLLLLGGSLIFGIVAQFILWLTHNVDLPGYLELLAKTPIANAYIGLVMYIISGGIFVLGLHKVLVSHNFFEDNIVEMPDFRNKKLFVFSGIGLFLYLVSVVVLIVTSNHILTGVLFLFALLCIAVGLIFANKPEKNLFNVHWVDMLVALIFVVVAYFLYSYNIDVLPEKVARSEALFALQTHSLASLSEVSQIFYPQMLLHSLQQQMFEVLGYNVYGLRLLSVIFAIITVFVFYFLSLSLFSRPVAIVSTAIMTFFHTFIAISRVGDSYISSVFIYVLTAFFLLNALKRNSFVFMFVAGLFAGLGYYLHSNAQIVFLIALIYLFFVLIKTPSFRKLLIKHIIVFLAAFTLMIGPYLVKNATAFTQKISLAPILAEQSMTHMKGVYNTDSSLGVFFKNTAHGLRSFNSLSDKNFLYGNTKSMLDFITAILFVLSLFVAVYLLKDDRYLFLLCSFLVIIVFKATLIIDPPKFPEMSLLLPVIALLVGSVLFIFTRVLYANITSSKLKQLLCLSTLSVITIIIVILNHNIYYNYYIGNNIAQSCYNLPTMIGKYIDNMGSFAKIYLVNFKEDPLFFTMEDETIRFLAPEAEARQLTKAGSQLPLNQKVGQDVHFLIFNYNYDKALNLLKSIYPAGESEIIMSDDDIPVMTIYKVSPASINARVLDKPGK
jgi:4-amino-4-deoxy-L-arabinose transferase-like glycosyltransferase